MQRNQTLFFFSLLIIQLQAQLQVRNYFSFTGRRDIPVNAIAQDQRGFLWIGTAEGLYTFDGRQSEQVAGNHSVLSGNISALGCDEKDRLWIGTASGKIYFLDGDKLDSLHIDSLKISERITSFYFGKGMLVAGTYGQGLVLYDGKTSQKFSHAQGLSDDVVYTVSGDGSQKIWCGTDAGISEIQLTEKGPRCRVVSSKDGLPDNIVRMLRYEKDVLHIAMQDSGICYYDHNKATFSRDPFFASWTLGAVLHTRTIDRDHYIATEKAGLIRISDGNFALHPYEEAGVQRVNCVFIDNTQQVWIGSQRGLSKFSERRLTMIGQSEGLPDKKVLALAVDNDNVIWTGTTKGIARITYNDKGRAVVSVVAQTEQQSVSCAAKAPQGGIWFGTYGSGILVYDQAGKKTGTIDSRSHGLPNDNISGIHFGEKGRVYISTLGGGLVSAVTDEKNGLVVQEVYNEEHGLGSNYVYQAITDNQGRLYAATDGGGLEALQNNNFINLSRKFRLKSNSVFSLCVDKRNTIWAVSNADGLLRFDERGLKTFRRGDGLRDEQPAQVVAWGHLLFLFHSKGIDRINTRNNGVSYYELAESETEPNLNAVCLHGEKIYSGTSNGVLVLRPQAGNAQTPGPTAYLKSITVNFDRIRPDSASTFEHNLNNFAFTISGTWLKDPEKLSFRYMLRGLDKEWETSAEGKTVNYNNLRPGRYTFVLQAKNEEDVWSEPATYEFTVLTPIWQRWWFWTIVLAGAGLGVYLFIRYRLHALQKENLILESRVQERTFEIEKQSQIIKKKNEELEQLSLVASKTDNVVLIMDPSGKLEYVNESFVKQHKMSFEEVKRKYGETIYELSNNPEIKDLVQNAVTNKRSVTYESMNKKEEAGRGLWQASTMTPIFSEDGSLKKIIIIDSDVTERKKQEQIIVQKNKDITDSIYYAKKIQHAILPSPDVISQHIPSHFILYMTKDIVSGDFYWFSHLGDSSIIAAVDCTGHGVPGAFMSLIGYNLLNRIVNEDRHTDPGEILLRLNRGVLLALHKNESESRDGMDIAICKINHTSNTIDFAGAMRPLWIVNNGNLKEIRADKIPIGTRQKDREMTIQYTTQSVEVQPGDRYFIFTDGYADQFGGEKDKKYSTARFKTILCNTSHMSFREQEEILRNEHLFWKGDHEQIDDILVMGFSVTPPAP